MEIPGIGSGQGTLTSAFAGASGELDRDAFLQLLVSQLENQDPLAPMQNEEFIAQLASFSSLDQLEELNGNVLAMIALNQSNALLAQLTQGSSLLGKTVGWSDPVTGASASGTVDSVRVVDGIAVLDVGGQEIPLAAVSEILDGDPEPPLPETDDQG